MTREELMRRALALARGGVLAGRGGPFGAVVAQDGRVVAEGENRVTSSLDPTAHAEVIAIRAACAALRRFDLRGCELFASCEPCPMCLGAIHWARLDRVYYAATRDDAAAAGFDDALLHRALAAPDAGAQPASSVPLARLLPEEGAGPFAAWRGKRDRVPY